MILKLLKKPQTSIDIQATGPLSPRSRDQECIRFSRNGALSIISIWAIKRVTREEIKVNPFKLGVRPYYYVELLSGLLIKLSREQIKLATSIDPSYEKIPSWRVLSALADTDEMVNQQDDRLWWYSQYSDFILDRYGVTITSTTGLNKEDGGSSVKYPSVARD